MVHLVIKFNKTIVTGYYNETLTVYDLMIAVYDVLVGGQQVSLKFIFKR